MMTSKEVAKCDAVENRRRSPLDHLPPPANSNKPLTPFSIEDILNKPSVKRSYTICGTAHLISSSEKHRQSSIPLSSRALLTQTSPLCALEELASKTFKGLEVSVLQAAEGKSPSPKNTHEKYTLLKCSITLCICFPLLSKGLYQTENDNLVNPEKIFFKCVSLIVRAVFSFVFTSVYFSFKNVLTNKGVLIFRAIPLRNKSPPLFFNIRASCVWCSIFPSGVCVIFL